MSIGADKNASQKGSNALAECRVCDDMYTFSGEKVPRLLQCGHTLCHSCLLRLVIIESQTIICPFDRQITSLGEMGVWSLKKNFALVELLERVHLDSCAGDAGTASTDDMLHNFELEKQLGIPCDENDTHVAILFCTVCESHLCVDCSDQTHNTRVLARHRRVRLSKKPQQKLKCAFHSAYAVEFTCLEENCTAESPLMCLLCRDYGRHVKHQQQIVETLGNISTTVKNIEGSDIDQINGSADIARAQVRKHFAELRNRLAAQEQAAVSVVDNHVRERVSALRHQEEDLATLYSQISAVAQQLDKSALQDDVKLISARKELQNLLSSVEKQQAQFDELALPVSLETVVPISFTKDNRVHIGPKIEMRVVVLGLNNAGKSALLLKLKNNEVVPTTSTIGFNVETLEYKNLRLTVWDVGGVPKLRPLWKHYYSNTKALIFVIDSSAPERFVEVQTELVKILAERELQESSLLILANKQDLPGSLPSESVLDDLALSKLCYGRSWYFQGCSAVTGHGLMDGLDWLSRQLVSAAGLYGNDCDTSMVNTVIDANN